MWLNELLHVQPGTRPTRPTSEKNVGRHKSLMVVTPSDTSDTSDTNNSNGTPPAPLDAQQTTFSEISYKKVESVRHLPPETAAPEPEAENYVNPWFSLCPDYFEGCFTCPDFWQNCPDYKVVNFAFCRRHPRPDMGVIQ